MKGVEIDCVKIEVYSLNRYALILYELNMRHLKRTIFYMSRRPNTNPIQSLRIKVEGPSRNIALLRFPPTRIGYPLPRESKVEDF